jgi:hypothetical protein
MSGNLIERRDVLNSPAHRVLLELADAGVQIRVVDGRVRLSPLNLITEDQRAALGAHPKAVRLLAIIGTDDGVQARVEEFSRQLAAEGDGAFRFETSPWVGVRCWSCGDATLRPMRCWRFVLSLRLACHVPTDESFADRLTQAEAA